MVEDLILQSLFLKQLLRAILYELFLSYLLQLYLDQGSNCGGGVKGRK